MPSRLPESPSPKPPGSSDPPEAMALEVARVTPSPYLLHPPLSYMSDVPSQSILRHTTFSSPLLVLPPLQIRQPESLGYDIHRHEPARILHPGHQNSRHPLTPFSNTLSDPLSSPGFSSVHSTNSDGMTNSEREMRTENSIAQRPAYARELRQKRDASEESTHFSSTPLGPKPFRHARLLPAVRRRNVEAVQYHRTSMRASTEAGRGSVKKTELVGTYDPRCSLEYEIIIRQQPLAARACGFGERDRRVIDPPPILQMIVRDPRATPEDPSPQLRYPHAVIHCELWNADDDVQETAIPEVGERRQQRRLMGTLVASPFYGRDELNVTGCFFPFPDLSCRTIGKYRLRFVLLLPNPASMRPGDSLPFRSVVVSNVFHVYTAKTFPGMEPSSALTKCLKEQGCQISVKKGHHRGDRMRDAPSRDEYNEADEDADGNGEDEEARSEKGREKRQKV